MGFFTTDDGVRLYYETAGNGEKTIVFVHGYTDSCAPFIAMSGELQKKYRVAAFDHRAHGQSETPKDGYTIERLAKDLRNFLDFLGTEKIIAIGYSMGSQALWSYIRQFGDSRFEKVIFSVMSPRLLTDDNYKLGLNGDFDAAQALGYITMANRSFEEYCLRSIREDMSEDEKAAIRENARELATTRDPGAMVRLLAAMFENDYWDVLPNISVHSLIIAGENDIYPIKTHETSAGMIPNSSLCIIKGCGHLVMYEKTGKYIDAILDFLETP